MQEESSLKPSRRIKVHANQKDRRVRSGLFQSKQKHQFSLVRRVVCAPCGLGAVQEDHPADGAVLKCNMNTDPAECLPFKVKYIDQIYNFA